MVCKPLLSARIFEFWNKSLDFETSKIDSTKYKFLENLATLGLAPKIYVRVAALA